MTEPKYRFENLGIHESLLVQNAIELRIVGMSNELKGSEKAIKAVLDELDLLYDDLSRHIAAQERAQYLYEKEKKEKELLKDLQQP